MPFLVDVSLEPKYMSIYCNRNAAHESAHVVAQQTHPNTRNQRMTIAMMITETITISIAAESDNASD